MGSGWLAFPPVELRIFTEPQLGATYDDLLAVARRTEETGFDAFFRSDHYLTMGGDGLPGPTDAWATLAGLARETSTIRLGTLMTSATFRLPGPLAISGGQGARIRARGGGTRARRTAGGDPRGDHRAVGHPERREVRLRRAALPGARLACAAQARADPAAACDHRGEGQEAHARADGPLRRR